MDGDKETRSSITVEEDNDTLLHVAVRAGNEEMLCNLLENRLSRDLVRKKGRDGKTALEIAHELGSKSMEAILAIHGGLSVEVGNHSSAYLPGFAMFSTPQTDTSNTYIQNAGSPLAQQLTFSR